MPVSACIKIHIFVLFFSNAPSTPNMDLLALLVYRTVNEAASSQFSINLCKRFLNQRGFTDSILQKAVRIFDDEASKPSPRPNTAQKRKNPRKSVLKVIYRSVQIEQKYCWVKTYFQAIFKRIFHFW